MGVRGVLFTSTVDFSDLTPQQVNGLIAIAVAIGTLYCFLGYRTLRFVLGLTGFLMAGGVAATLANWISQGNQLATLVALLIGGLCGAFALYFLYRTGVFFLGLMGTALISHNVLAAQPDTWIPLVVLGLAVAGGLFALLIERPVILLATAALGAWMVVSGVAYFIVGSSGLDELTKLLESEDHRTIVVASWAVLAIAGALSQMATTKRKRKAA
ncbi:MAG: TMEM198/TM7SF3 family protein [Candidatus Hydrogenedentes bacterium]|nr:TMEM198/TM7SF3 family protein [Candidatus Hydrogenedentota bacterium]